MGRDLGVLHRLSGLGADAVVELRTGEATHDLAVRLLAAGGPVDVVLDGIYGRPLEAALQVCAPRARVVNIGNLAGPVAQVPAGLLRGRQLTLSGFAALHLGLEAKEAALTWLWSALRDGHLQVDTLVFDLDDLPAAWARQAASPHAKCVVVPNPNLLDLSRANA
ncbi:MAG: zinc-binding dehydrogenase [Actinomycetota bacterium]|nr:zinc-binding dehydrogenase [Actinomycetota bacterium]